MMGTLTFGGVNLVLPDRLIRGWIELAAGKISFLSRSPPSVLKGAVYNLPSLYVAPGFIDIQVNGGASYNFDDATIDEIIKIVEFHIAHGTTGMLATFITAPVNMLRDSIEKIRTMRHPAIYGVHLEGPFISPKLKGAHNLEHVLPISLTKFEELVDGNQIAVRVVTFAPELLGADALLSKIVKIEAIPAIGHSDATYEEALAAIAAGVRLFTHLGNAMRGLHHREPGAVGAALDSDAYVELICDGIHLHPAFVRLVARVKGYDRICLVTDAISAAGLPDGQYSLGGRPVWVQDGAARLPDGTLAGSTLTMNQAVRNFREFTGCSLPEAVRCATLNPARLLGLDARKGSLTVGKDADLVIFDDELTVHYTILAGKIVYAREA